MPDMPDTYTSLFDGPTIITKKDMCALLNLDTSRQGLVFSTAEINSAYKKRALRFHPDRQAHYPDPIPVKTCNVLLSDIVLAKDYLIAGEDNIPGKACLDRAQSVNTFTTDDWIPLVISLLSSIKIDAAQFSSSLSSISFWSHPYVMIVLMSTFSEGELNFRYVNLLSKQLEILRPFLNKIDSDFIVQILKKIQSGLQSIEADELDRVLQNLRPQLAPFINDDARLDDLLLVIKDMRNELSLMLTDENINHLQHILTFWPNFLATVPTWGQLVGVYFTALIVTSISLPKFFNALLVIIDAILQQKGAVALALVALPLAVVTAIVLPINIALQLSVQWSWIALRAAFKAVVEALQLLYSITSLLYSRDFSYQNTFPIVEHMLNLVVRPSFTVPFESLNTLIFILTNQDYLSSILTYLDEGLDEFINYLKPKDQSYPVTISERPPQSHFFAPPQEEDVWLNQLLIELPRENVDVECQALNKGQNRLNQFSYNSTVIR